MSLRSWMVRSPAFAGVKYHPLAVQAEHHSGICDVSRPNRRFGFGVVGAQPAERLGPGRRYRLDHVNRAGIAQRIACDGIREHFHFLADDQPRRLDQAILALHVSLVIELIAQYAIVGRADAELTRRARIALQKHSASPAPHSPANREGSPCAPPIHATSSTTPIARIQTTSDFTVAWARGAPVAERGVRGSFRPVQDLCRG